MSRQGSYTPGAPKFAGGPPPGLAGAGRAAGGAAEPSRAEPSRESCGGARGPGGGGSGRRVRVRLAEPPPEPPSPRGVREELGGKAGAGWRLGSRASRGCELSKAINGEIDYAA